MKPVTQATLQATIASRFASQNAFCWAARIRPCVLSDLLRGRRLLTPYYALKIQQALDLGPGGAGLVYDTTLKGGEAK